jgi:hypothetical protein
LLSYDRVLVVYRGCAQGRRLSLVCGMIPISANFCFVIMYLSLYVPSFNLCLSPGLCCTIFPPHPDTLISHLMAYMVAGKIFIARSRFEWYNFCAFSIVPSKNDIIWFHFPHKWIPHRSHHVLHEILDLPKFSIEIIS